MTPQELVMSVQLLVQQVADLSGRLDAAERGLRVAAKATGPTAPQCPSTPKPRPSRRDLQIVDAALARVSRETGITVLEILNGGRGTDLVEARRKVANLARLEGLSESAIARAMGCDRSAISRGLRKAEGEL